MKLQICSKLDNQTDNMKLSQTVQNKESKTNRAGTIELNFSLPACQLLELKFFITCVSTTWVDTDLEF